MFGVVSVWNNCIVWSHLEYVRMRAAWYLHGRPMQREPIIYARPSDHKPYSTNHWVVGYINRYTGLVTEARSFVPDDPKATGWLGAVRRLLFRGHIKHGDVPDNHH